MNNEMEKTIFVVDDSVTNLATAAEALEDHYTVMTIASGKKAISLLEKVRPDLVLLDIEMPEMDGFDILKHLKNTEQFKDIPVIFLTAVLDAEIETRALEMGVVDFISKPFSVPILLNRIKIHLDMRDIIHECTSEFCRAKHDIILVLANEAENRDEPAGDHLGRTSRLVCALLEKMKEDKIYYDQVKNWDPNSMAESSLLHDVGKINMPDAILLKPGKLTPEEFGIMKHHVMAGKNIIEKIIARNGENVVLRNSIIFATYHHERWDGTGYPHGLAGDEIPLLGRIMAIVDVYDALISKRVYKEAISSDQAVEIIKNKSGTHFDPKIVDVFCDILNRPENAS